MPSRTAPPPVPASRAWVFATATVIVAVLAVVLPTINPATPRGSILFMGWFPALLASRLGWAAHVGAIRERVISEDVPVSIGNKQRWAIAVRSPRVLTAVDNRTRFQLYLLLELAITGLVWLAIVGPSLGPLVRAASAGEG